MKLPSLLLFASAALASVAPADTLHLRPRAGSYDTCEGDEVASTCPEDYICTADPRKDSDGASICVLSLLAGNFCGGFAGFACPNEGEICFEYPYDDCDPEQGGADCGGWCI